ncbi:MAG: hypothetical protein EKK41_14970 [Hyphomicrobiales bacterium]|nr:MAG: hypothetical protein EKK41_14970 [Hyphomicrobiales bacterium]
MQIQEVTHTSRDTGRGRCRLLPLGLALVFLAGTSGLALAQAPQPGTPAAQPPISGPAPEATPPPPGPPAIAEEGEDDEDDDMAGEGCPYVPNTLELMV